MNNGGTTESTSLRRRSTLDPSSINKSEDKKGARPGSSSLSQWLFRLPIRIWETIIMLWSLNETRLIQPSTPGHIGPLASGTVESDGDTKSTVGRWIIDNVPSLKTKYRPTWWLPNGHFQTGYMVAGDFTKIDKVEYIRTLLRVPDGGTIGLDFAPPSHDSFSPTTPTIVFCHGLTGGSHESYVRSVLARIIKPVKEGGLGVRAVVINSRGCAGVPVTSDQLYSAGTTIDLSTALHYLRATYPRSPLHGIGFSLGAAFLTRYFGESSSASLLSSGVVLGVPGNMPCLSVRLENHWFYSRVYSRAMGANLVNLFFRQYSTNPGLWDKSERITPAGLERLKEMRIRGATLKTVDGPLTAQIGGPNVDGMWPFGSADEYYAWASPHQVLQGVKRPLLWVNAMDDPIIDSRCSPITEVQASSHIVMALTARGGHLGWFTGGKAKDRWITGPVVEFFTAAMRDLPLAGAAVETIKGSSSGPTDEDCEKVPRSDSVQGMNDDVVVEPQGDDTDTWEWVKTLAHEVQGVRDGRLGWRVVSRGEVVHGEEGTGVMQGL